MKLRYITLKQVPPFLLPFPFHISQMPSLNFMTGEDPLSLDRIRSVLTRLEDTIIFLAH